MFKIIGILLLGTFIGRLLNNSSKIKFAINKMVMIVIFILLFLLGVSIGKNDIILDNLSSLGVLAWWLTLGAVLGSVLLSKIVYVKLYKNINNER